MKGIWVVEIQGEDSVQQIAAFATKEEAENFLHDLSKKLWRYPWITFYKFGELFD